MDAGTYTLGEMVGVFGASLYVFAYFSLQTGRLHGRSGPYLLINLTAATCVLFGLTERFNLASALIQGFWIAISIYGLWRLSQRRRQALRPAWGGTEPGPAPTARGAQVNERRL